MLTAFSEIQPQLCSETMTLREMLSYSNKEIAYRKLSQIITQKFHSNWTMEIAL